MIAANVLANLESEVRAFAERGGPEPHEYQTMTDWYNRVADYRLRGVITCEQAESLRPAFGKVYEGIDNLLGRIFHKPYGYAGDFSVIEAFYNHQVSDDPQLTKWDLYIQDMDAAKAVRNRKTFFKRLIGQHRGDGSTDTRVLNLACGSCRDVYEVLNEYPNARFRFDCVDLDPHAIECASALLGSDNERVNLLRGNVLRFNPGQKKYDLIWSAGLFDYFNDRIFVRLIRRMKKWLEPGGKIVIGNFNEGNPSEHAMAFTEWLLHYRDEDQLRRLAIEAGCVPESISVEQEVTGINLFLTIE